MMARSNEEEQQIRAAAESILGSSSSHHQLPSHECSLNTVLSEVIPPGDIVMGVRQGGRMSVVRRFFCLFVTFDLLFTILMWLICIMLVKEDVFKTMSEQIIHYSIHSSLFDVVMTAAVRFVVLLLFYALLYMNHWCIIALSTAGTCCFLIAKVFLYNWLSANSPVFQVLLIITSFVISWGEAWFFDFRVIPQELIAHDIIRGRTGVPNERSPLLAPYLQGLSNRHDDVPESVRNFYSPMDSLAGSDEEKEEEKQPSHTISRKELATDTEVQAHDALQAAWRSLTNGGWRRERSGPNGDIIDSRPRQKGGKVYRLEGQVAITPQRLLHLLFNELDSFPVWNPTFRLARRLEVINEHTDISYHVIAEAGGGLVASRDFVTLRYWEKRGCVISLVSVSTSHPAAPPTAKPIRAIQGPTCWVMEPGPTSGVARVRWLLDTELRGWIPPALLDQAFATAMLEWMSHLRKHAAALEARSSDVCCASTSKVHNG